MWTLYRVLWGVVCVVFAAVGIVGFALALVNRDTRTPRRSYIGEIVIALVAVSLWLGLLSYFFVTFVLRDWQPRQSRGPVEDFVLAALFAAGGCAFMGIAVLFARSVFGPPPKWLQEMKQVREKISGRRGKASANVGSGSADQRRENGDDREITDDTLAGFARLSSNIEKVSWDPRKIVASLLMDKVSDALVFSRVGRLLAAALLAVHALIMFRTVPSLARGEQPQLLKRIIDYEQGLPLAVATLIITAIVILGLAILPMAGAWAEHEDGRLVISKRSTRWLVAFAGYGLVASLIVGASMLGWTGWLVGQVRDAWQQLVVLPP